MNSIIQLRKTDSDTAPWHTITADQLAAYCVEISGGGYNAQQVYKAMVLNRTILALKLGETWRSIAGVIEFRILKGD